MKIPLNCSECDAPLAEETRRPFVNLCFVCALSIYIERLASFALKGPPRKSEVPPDVQAEAQIDAQIDAMTEAFRKMEEILRKKFEERRRLES
jgi:acyl carrier protein phosphodiesterase